MNSKSSAVGNQSTYHVKCLEEEKKALKHVLNFEHAIRGIQQSHLPTKTSSA